MPTFYPGQTDYIDQLNALVPFVGPGSGQFLAGTAGAPAITFATSTQSGWYLDAVNQPALSTSGVRRLFVTAAGLLTVSSGATITGNFTTAGPTNATNIASDQTSGVLNLGGIAGTGTITLGQSTGAQTVNIGTGITATGITKRVNIGENGAAGSSTFIGIGSAGAGTTIISLGVGGINDKIKMWGVVQLGGVQLGTAKLSLVYAPSTNTGIVLQPSTNTGGPTPISFLNAAGTTVGSVTTTATATSYVTSSDYRLKENILPITNALTRVAALKPVTYIWKSNGENSDGFIAHELAEVCPNAVIGSKDDVDSEGNPKYQGIDASFLIATLTAAIQEQQTLIASLTNRIATLETK